MKEMTTLPISQAKQLNTCLLAESPSDQSVFRRIVVWAWGLFLLRKADYPAARQMEKSRTRWHLVHIMLCLVLIGPSLMAPFIETQIAWAAPARLAHQDSPATHLIAQRPQDVFTDIAQALEELVKIFNMFMDVIGAMLQYDFAGWVACALSAGAVPCPTASATPWSFDCPIITTTQAMTWSSQPMYNLSSQAVYVDVVDGSTSETIYQIASQTLAPQAQVDWLSGDADVNNTSASSVANEPGHLMYTYGADTLFRPGMQTLSGISLGVALAMIGPLFALAGFQLLLASVKTGTEKAIANAMDTLGRVLLAGAIVGLAFYIINVLFTFLNQVNAGVIALHGELPYSNAQTTINGQTVTYSPAGDQSFRGLVIPMADWGCVMDDFISLMATRAANAIGSMIPVIGGLLGIAGRAVIITMVIRDIGEFVLLLTSVMIWGQAVARIILINYYIILAPVAFACWGLPGNIGMQVVRAWFKGFLQLLFMQTVQLFILTTLPFLMPDFGKMQFPTAGELINGPLLTFLVQVPPIITAFAAVGAPKIMMGMGPMKTVAQAGSLAGKAVAAAMLAANSLIKG